MSIHGTGKTEHQKSGKIAGQRTREMFTGNLRRYVDIHL